MKKLFVALLVGVFALVSCSGGNNPEVADEMQEFLDTMIRTKSVYEAASIYGYEDAALAEDYREVVDPIVTKSEQKEAETYYYITVTHQDGDSDLIVVWKDGLVVDIRD